MTFSVKDYVDYCVSAAALIAENKDYITELDAVTGDGDHWANMNMGFQQIVDSRQELENISYADLFKKIGMMMMKGIGGSSGVLYGSAYLSASKIMEDVDNLDINRLSQVITAMLEGICKRGNSGPGMKTMIDTLDAAASELKAALTEGVDERKALERMEQGAKRGMESTARMEAVRGRAGYQADKGVGHLDPGAVTMYYQLKTLSDCMQKNAGTEKQME